MPRHVFLLSQLTCRYLWCCHVSVFWQKAPLVIPIQDASQMEADEPRQQGDGERAGNVHASGSQQRVKWQTLGMQVEGRQEGSFLRCVTIGLATKAVLLSPNGQMDR